jgi:dihydrolipoamide dehydrogenase
MKTYDLIVIGSGAGLSVLNAGMQKGLKCALIEKDKMGGTCLNRGCIPSKVLTTVADTIKIAERGKKIGVSLKLDSLDWELISRRLWSQIDENKNIEEGISSLQSLDTYRGSAEFTGKMKLRVVNPDGTVSPEFSGSRIVLASGGRSLLPPITGIEETGYVTTETFFGESFPERPWKSLILVGGGIIAAEFAHIFSALGTKVTIVEMAPGILATEEPEVSEFVGKNLKKRMKIFTNCRAVAARKDGDNKYLTIDDTETGLTSELEAEEIFISAGRRSNSDILSVEKCGIDTYGSGEWIKTNEFLETNVEGVWAIGDANGLFQFRHKANAEAEVLIKNIFDKDRKAMDYSAVPWAIFTDPQVGHVGLTEEEAIEQGHQIFRAKMNYSYVAKGFAMGYSAGDDDDGFVKLIIDRSMRILGAHVVGPYADILVQPFVYMMNSGYSCPVSADGHERAKYNSIRTKLDYACPGAGSVMPLYESMVIHPSLNEVTGWVLGSLEPVNIPVEHHRHK